jgi:hypothetical protein
MVTSKQIEEWTVSKERKYRGEAKAFPARLKTRAGKAEIRVDRHGILGFGDRRYQLIGLTVRKDSLRLYANIYALAAHKACLARRSPARAA